MDNKVESDYSLQQLLKATLQREASDLHVVVGSPPVLRVNGRMIRVKSEVLNPEQTRKLCYSVLTDVQKSRFEEARELDFSFGVKGVARFRGNLFYQKGAVSGVFRRVPIDVPDWQSLGIPQSVGALTNVTHGLVLVTGPTGSGKSTTIASLVDKINEEKMGHIITLEDPIEFVHKHKNCIVNQREVGHDTNSYKVALKHLLRQDPDFCVLGELRDLETIEAALTIAETGHLVFATLHTNSAVSTLTRLVGVYPSDQQERVLTQLSAVLQGVIAQRLLPSGETRVAAYEVLLFPPSIRNLVRENKLHQIYGMMQVGQDKSGMRTMNQSLVSLLMRRKIELRSAFEYSNDPEELDQMLKKAGF